MTTSMETTLSISGRQHRLLVDHLFPGDGREAITFALCGRYRHGQHERLLVREVLPVPHHLCQVRAPDQITWPTETLPALLDRANLEGLSVLKIHSHTSHVPVFSPTDDVSDRSLFQSVWPWVDGGPHVSAIMLPDGRLIARTVDQTGAFADLPVVKLVGDDIRFWRRGSISSQPPQFAIRTAQAFGAGTVATLRGLSVAVIGCSGTGSPLIEQLARLGVGRLVIVDPDHMGIENLGRIVNSTMEDVNGRVPKVEVMRRAVAALGLGTEVEIYATSVATPAAVRAVASCDVVFGCVDTHEGRHVLNRLATFYLLPYFDVGVRLDPDGSGGVTEVVGSVHYLQPGGSSLMSRGAISLDQVRAEAMKRTDPRAYMEDRKAGYLATAGEGRPAVISVNMAIASLAVNELLARLHPNFRRDLPNSDVAVHRFSISGMAVMIEGDGDPCEALGRHVGRGDVVPLLGMPALSEEDAARAEA